MATHTPYIKPVKPKAPVLTRAMFYWYDPARSVESLKMMAHVEHSLRANPTFDRVSVLPEPRWTEFLREAV